MKFIKNILSGICILAFLSSGMLTAVAQDSADQARSYCVRSGYLYSTSPGINDDQGMCMFPDKSWCDSQAFFQGDCSRSLTPNILPGYVSESESMYTAVSRNDLPEQWRQSKERSYALWRYYNVRVS